MGNESWGLRLVEVEDYSDATLCNLAAETLLSQSQPPIDMFLGPYSSSLTLGVLNISETHGKVLMSAGSNQANVWTDLACSTVM